MKRLWSRWLEMDHFERCRPFYDAGFDVRLGDALNGFVAHRKVETWVEVEAWLRD